MDSSIDMNANAQQAVLNLQKLIQNFRQIRDQTLNNNNNNEDDLPPNMRRQNNSQLFNIN